MAKKTIKDLGDLKGKRVLVRVDFNVPMDEAGQITNDRRIVGALPTLQHLLKGGASLIVMSHLGQPDGDPGAADFRQKNARLSMDRVAERLRKHLGSAVHKSDEVVGSSVSSAAHALKPGEVLLLENLRFHPGEKSKSADFTRELAGLADIYVNDAFGTCH
ncbi:MAG: phosphoglycerate kinase, partial [Gemmataceae bacterium]